jgi:hypothetical protein
MPKNLSQTAGFGKFMIAALLLIISAQITFAQSSASLLLHPKPHEGYEIKDGKIYFRQGQAGLILELATPEKIAAYYHERGSEVGNPFVKLGGELGNATIFLLTLLNRTHSNLTFTPRYVLAKIKSDAYFALDYTVLLDIMDSPDNSLGKLLEKSIYHSPELLDPGKVITKFLVFPQLPKKFDELKMEFDYMYFGNFEVKSTFYFTTK